MMDTEVEAAVPLAELADLLDRPVEGSTDEVIRRQPERSKLLVEILKHYDHDRSQATRLMKRHLPAAEQVGWIGASISLDLARVQQMASLVSDPSLLERLLAIEVRLGHLNSAGRLAARIGRRLSRDEVFTVVQARWMADGSTDYHHFEQFRQFATEHLGRSALPELDGLIREKIHRNKTDIY